MGWLWGSSAPEKPAESQSSGQASATAEPPQSSTSSPETDPEITKFLEELAGELRNARNATGQSSSSTQQPPSHQPPAATKTSSSWSSWWSGSATPPSPSEAGSSSTSQTTPQSGSQGLPAAEALSVTSAEPPIEPSLSPLAESLLPTTMDCEQAFNQAFYCQSLGGQWNNIYRYGGVRSCSDNWDDFWFCMRVKGYQPGPVKDDMIREHYRKRHLAKYGPGKPSSEDVWRERRERVPPGTAFSEQVEAPTISDAEYQKWEMERMGKIRNGTAS